MAKFLFAYHGGKQPESEAEGAKAMAAWGAWFESLGADLVDAGAPVGQSHTISASGSTDNGGANPVSGYTLVNAASYDTALKIAKGCPMVADGSGSVEVAECVEM
jgi:hypothetical protein